MDAQKMTNAIIETLFNEFQNMGKAADSIGQKLDIVSSIISTFYLKIELDRLASGAKVDRTYQCQQAQTHSYTNRVT